MEENRHLAKVCFNQNVFYHSLEIDMIIITHFFLIEKETDTCIKARQMIRDDFLCRFFFALDFIIL
jgi:hypothetical protein